MESDQAIDVTAIEPQLKHPRIFERFDTLLPGESFIIINDHDPRPLYFQLRHQKGETVGWDYLEKGPAQWKVKISRNEHAAGENTIAAIVTRDARKAGVFRKYGIDFCCGGKKTIEEVCREKNIDQNKLVSDLRAGEKHRTGIPENAAEWNVGFLADYIVNIHHNYTRRVIPDLLAWSEKVAKVHGETHPETKRVSLLFRDVANELGTHMAKEENVLFPYIHLLAAAVETGTPPPPAGFETVRNPVSMMHEDHEYVGNRMKQLRLLTNNYAAPADACNTYRALYAGLGEFEEDLFLHIHLENNILFPKAILLENIAKDR